MKFIAFLFLLPAFVLLSNEAKAQNTYYPLEKGKTWIYKYTEDFISSSGSKSKIEILTRTEKINGKEYLLMQTSIGDDEQYDILQTSYLRNAGNGRVFGLANSEMAEEHILLAEEPLSMGKTWKAEADGQMSTSVVVGINESLTTPVKTFNNCLVIETEMGDAKIKSYFQKGIGLIASSLLLPDGEKLMQYMVE